jgi:hypothetical protein
LELCAERVAKILLCGQELWLHRNNQLAVLFIVDLPPTVDVESAKNKVQNLALAVKAVPANCVHELGKFNATIFVFGISREQLVGEISGPVADVFYNTAMNELA